MTNNRRSNLILNACVICLAEAGYMVLMVALLKQQKRQMIVYHLPLLLFYGYSLECVLVEFGSLNTKNMSVA